MSLPRPETESWVKVAEEGDGEVQCQSVWTETGDLAFQPQWDLQKPSITWYSPSVCSMDPTWLTSLFNLRALLTPKPSKEPGSHSGFQELFPSSLLT